MPVAREMGLSNPKRIRESHILALDGKRKVALRIAICVPDLASLLERLAEECSILVTSDLRRREPFEPPMTFTDTEA